MIKLSRRLQAVYDEILPCDSLVDVGCDHGKIVVNAAVNDIAKTAIARDISEDSLAKAVALAAQYNVSDRVVAQLADGLENYGDTNRDTIVIAGMGGLQIANILEKDKLNPRFRRYVLLPHRNAYELRKTIIELGLVPIKDYIVLEDGRFYNIIVAEVGIWRGSKRELYLGMNNIHDTTYVSYLKHAVEHNSTAAAHSADDGYHRVLQYYIECELKSMQ